MSAGGVIFAVSGCAAESADPISSETSGSIAEASGFTGPWKSEFTRYYNGTTSALAKSILADEQITEAEVAEINNVFRECLEGAGFVRVEIGEYGTLSVGNPPGASEEERAELRKREGGCEASTGWDRVIPLFVDIRGNPDKGDNSGAIASCLVRAGLRPTNYTVEDFREEYVNNGDFGFASYDPEYPKFLDCMYNPYNS
jgi:hypothetical protein